MKTSIYLSSKTGIILKKLLEVDNRFTSKSDVIRFALEELAKKYNLTKP